MTLEARHFPVDSYSVRSFKSLFSSTVFGEIPRYSYSLGVGVVRHRRRAKSVTFCNIYVITEDIYLKLGMCVHYSKSNPYYQRRQYKMLFFFFSELCPFSNKTFSFFIKHPTAERLHPYAGLMFFRHWHRINLEACIISLEFCFQKSVFFPKLILVNFIK